VTIDAFVEKLISIAKSNGSAPGHRAFLLMERLEDMVPDIKPGQLRPLIIGLVVAGDELIETHKPPPAIFGSKMDIQIDRVVLRLLRRIDRTLRGDVLIEAFDAARGLAAPCNLVAHYMSDAGQYKNEAPIVEEKRDISAEDLARIKACFKGLVEARVAEGMLLGSTNLLDVLYRWGECDTPEAPRAWVSGVVKGGSDNDIEKLLASFVQNTYSQGMSDAIGKSTRRCSPNAFKAFIEPAEVVARVEQIASPNEDAAQLKKEWALIQKGVNVDSPSYD